MDWSPFEDFLRDAKGQRCVRSGVSVFVVAACLLSGCAVGGDTQIYAFGMVGQRIVGNEAYVTIHNVYNEMDALPLAEKHCAQHDRIARFNRMESLRAIFDCVRRS